MGLKGYYLHRLVYRLTGFLIDIIGNEFPVSSAFHLHKIIKKLDLDICIKVHVHVNVHVWKVGYASKIFTLISSIRRQMKMCTYKTKKAIK